MKQVKDRISEFCEYHKNGDGECNSIVLKKWADNHRLTYNERWRLAYMFSITYCVPSAIMLYESKEPKKTKELLIFQSDRRWVGYLDRFEHCIEYYYEHLTSPEKVLKSVMHGNKLYLQEAIELCMNWYYFSRFASYLFLEMFVWLTDIDIKNSDSIDWKNGDTATSGLMNLYGFDREADCFDKTSKLMIKKADLDRMLYDIKQHISRTGGNTNITNIETSLCAYRKFYKETRYNGFYLDRMLSELKHFEKKHSNMVQELYSIRKECFDSKFLGEIMGWNGIRAEMKKKYIREGVI